MSTYSSFIEINTDKRFGRPCIKGTRIAVYDVLNWFANGMTLEQILNDFEELSEEKILACLAYAADKEHKIRVA
ncbi:DUF433 domain-containing protein [Pedobacter changchengzhani]|uniref:DUF433 domain-containing protein n=1 Tax=Pedobacter changchengzhani TaxID=2529274 RepID=A0A4R5MMY6_9SPHI|nr:DUF433 domain-containing protein [Pedobacter changchengzhani]TDG37074.1 DUF433 domain-containing protein [Pedobacter changchengzhani]